MLMVNYISLHRSSLCLLDACLDFYKIQYFFFPLRFRVFKARKDKGGRHLWPSEDAGETVLSYILRAVVKVIVILPFVPSVAMSKTLAHLPQRLRFMALGCVRSHGRPGTTLDPAVIDTWTKFAASAVRVHP